MYVALFCPSSIVTSVWVIIFSESNISAFNTCETHSKPSKSAEMNVVRPRLPIRALVLEIIIIIATTVAITETIANEVAVPTRGDTTAAMDIIETETVTRVAIVIPTETETEETVESADVKEAAAGE
jgi:hypothetical protein